MAAASHLALVRNAGYAYGVLYGLVEKACIVAGLDPFVGFLHTDNYNKTSLVFHLIEPFRIKTPGIDRTANCKPGADRSTEFLLDTVDSVADNVPRLLACLSRPRPVCVRTRTCTRRQGG